MYNDGITVELQPNMYVGGGYSIMSMQRPKEHLVAIRMPIGLLKFIDQDNEENYLHSSRTDWILTACMMYREKRMHEIREHEEYLKEKEEKE